VCPPRGAGPGPGPSWRGVVVPAAAWGGDRVGGGRGGARRLPVRVRCRGVRDSWWPLRRLIFRRGAAPQHERLQRRPARPDGIAVPTAGTSRRDRAALARAPADDQNEQCSRSSATCSASASACLPRRVSGHGTSVFGPAPRLGRGAYHQHGGGVRVVRGTRGPARGPVPEQVGQPRGQDLYRRLELGEITQEDWNEGFGALLGFRRRT
jgi:hypothetical protein